MGAYQSKVFLSELENGMFVCQLPIPWKETPFPLQGFFIRSQGDVDELSKYCEYVLIDTIRSRSTISSKGSHASKTQSNKTNCSKEKIESATNISVTKKHQDTYIRPVKIKSDRYSKTLPSDFSKELKKVKRVHAKILKSIESISEQLAKGDERSISSLNKHSAELVESTINNPNSAIWLTQLESQRSDLFQHSVNATVWAIVFGRHLGLEPVVLQDITLALLLAKIGLLKAPGSEQPLENDNPYAFIERSIALIKDCSNVNQRVINTIRTHLERHDGSGSPYGLTGSRIPLVGKIAGIADYYEALINPLGNKRALCSSEASQLLFSLRNTKFQGDLIEEFIKAIGIYPTGSIVELDSNELGIVVESKPNMRLSPKLLIITDTDHEPLSKPKVINMAENKVRYKISRSLPSSSVCVKVSSFHIGGFSRFSA